MQKTAKPNNPRRGILSRIRENIDYGGMDAESKNPEFQQLMNKLRNEIDDPIRAIATGETVGSAYAPTDPISLKDLLKLSRSNFNRREYMRSIDELSRFHKKIESIVNILKSFVSTVDEVHHKFLFGDLSPEEKKRLRETQERIFGKKSEQIFTNIKEAGIVDFFSNIGTERGRALSAWEKRYPRKISKLKSDTKSLLDRSDKLFAKLMMSFKKMAAYRATRKVDDYIKEGSSIIAAHQEYHNIFADYYKEHVTGFLAREELLAPKETVPALQVKELGKQEVVVVPSTTQKPADKTTEPDTGPITSRSPVPVMETTQGPTQILPTVNDPTIRDPELAALVSGKPAPKPISKPISNPVPIHPDADKTPDVDITGKPKALKPPPGKPYTGASHKLFLQSLEVLSNEDPIVLASHIKKYAESIKKSDPVSALQLLKIVQQIKGQ